MEKTNTRKGRRKSSTIKKIPTFGDWESVNDMPITQYFDSARQAGLIKIQPNEDSTGNFNYHIHNCNTEMYAAPAAVGGFHQQYPSYQQYYPAAPALAPCPHQLRNNNKETRRSQQLQRSHEMMTTTPVTSCHKQRGTNKKTEAQHSVKTTTAAAAAAPSKPKPVDEDLYKIPPHLLLIHSSSLQSPRRRKKKLGFISRCLVPCAA